MKILLCGYMFSRGGIQIHTHWLANGLTELGHAVTVASPPQIAGSDFHLLPDANYQLVTIERLRQVLRGYPLGRRAEFDVAVVAGTGWKSMIGLLCNRRIARRAFFEVMSGDAAGLLDPRRLIHLGFDDVISIGTDVQRKFSRAFHWRGKGAIIPALPQPLERVAAIAARGVIRSVGKPRAYYFGRLTRAKGVGFLIENWPALSQYLESIDIYGAGDDQHIFEQQIAQGVQPGIRLHGINPRGQYYADLIQRFDLLLLPTVGQEGIPLVLLEAMACGTPFVANGMGGIADLANPDCSITSGAIADFIPATAELAGRIVREEVDGARLQRHYEQNFSYDILLHRWNDHLTELADGPIQ